MRKPTMDPIYPTFTVGETGSNIEITKVAAVTEPNSDQHKLMEVIRRTLANTELPESEAGDSRYTRTVATAVEGISTEYTATDIQVVVR